MMLYGLIRQWFPFAHLSLDGEGAGVAAGGGPPSDGGDGGDKGEKKGGVGQPAATRDPAYYAKLEADAKAAFAKRDEATRMLREVEAQANEMRKRLDAIDAEKKRAEEDARRKALEDEGKYQEALEFARKKHEEALREVENRYLAVIEERAVAPRIKAALAAVPDIVAEAVGDAALILREQIAMDPKTFELFVKDADGKPMKDPETLKPVSVEAYAKKWASERPWLLKAGKATGSGSDPGGGTGGGGQKYSIAQAVKDPVYSARWKTADPKGWKDAWAEYNRRKMADPSYDPSKG